MSCKQYGSAPIAPPGEQGSHLMDQMGSGAGFGLAWIPPGPVTSVNWFCRTADQFVPFHSARQPNSMSGRRWASGESAAFVLVVEHREPRVDSGDCASRRSGVKATPSPAVNAKEISASPLPDLNRWNMRGFLPAGPLRRKSQVSRFQLGGIRARLGNCLGSVLGWAQDVFPFVRILQPDR